jgi:hypothetical protein
VRPRFILLRGGAFFLAGIATLVHVSATKGAKAPLTSGESKTIACRVLEAHISAERGVTIVIFHQSAREDQECLSNLLKQNTGATVEWQSGNASWHAATVVRLKSCFGRGLLIVPAGGETPKDGETILVKFPEAEPPSAR